MVSAHTNLSRKFRNTDSIIKSNKSNLIPTLHSKFPGDYVDEKTHNTMQKVKPWAEIPSPIARETFGIMGREIPPIIYERWERQKKYGFTSLQPITNPPGQQERYERERRFGFSSLQNPIIPPGEIERRKIDQRYGFASLQPIVIDDILVLCVDFPDKPAQIPVETIYSRFFVDNTNSLREYYREISHGRYVPTGSTHGWYRAPQPSTYYTDKQNGFGTYPNSAEKLVEDVVEMASQDPNIDWESFDTNQNGYIDNIFIVHAGAEAAYTGDINDFWAHVFVVPTPKVIGDKSVWVYAMTSEYLSKPSDPTIIGGDCHEFGHLLGLPDLYDYSDNSNGVGAYSLMGAGSWGNMGMTPTHMDAWSKCMLGFVDAEENPTGNVYLDNAETSSNIVKYTTDDPKQYFLVENRQKIRYDEFLPSEGMLIWRINENQIDNQTYNDNKSCFLVGLLQADGLQDLENRANNGDLGDAYPGISNNRSFGANTNPKSQLCDMTIFDILINNISDSDTIMTFESLV